MISLSRKISLLGDFAVGKTSTVARSVRNPLSDAYLTTVGVKVHTKTVLHTEGHSLRLVLWDIAGANSLDQMRANYIGGTQGLMLVADGMGGHLHGELAAHIATQYITQAFQREARPRLPDPGLFLSPALTGAHHALLADALDRLLPEAPRTTLVACVVQDGAAHWAHAGDSRLYLLRHGHIVTRTRDHSRTQLMLDQGLLQPEDAHNHPGRNRLYSCLGGNHAPQVEHSPRTPLRDGDVIALFRAGARGPAARRDRALLVGPLARLELTPLDQPTQILEAHLPADEFRRLGVQEGDMVSVSPRKARVFLEVADDPAAMI